MTWCQWDGNDLNGDPRDAAFWTREKETIFRDADIPTDLRLDTFRDPDCWAANGDPALVCRPCAESRRSLRTFAVSIPFEPTDEHFAVMRDHLITEHGRRFPGYDP